MIQILHDALWYDVMLEQMDAENEKTWLGDRWIVHSRHGARVNKDTPSKWFRDFADAHGYRSIRFHDLRHIHASLLVANHIDIAAVAARMGHSDPSVTLNVYTHPTSPADQDAAQALDRLLRAALGQDEGATV